MGERVRVAAGVCRVRVAPRRMVAQRSEKSGQAGVVKEGQGSGGAGAGSQGGCIPQTWTRFSPLSGGDGLGRRG
jgi:hypothetical protein